MQCPQGDGELIAHTTAGENNLAVSYSTCPTCGGHWMDSFAANFIKLSPDDLQRTGAKLVHPRGVLLCPICQQQLTRTTGENIPDQVTVYSCPDHHGYFFPTGQLAAFKKAQKAKIAYHKLWSIPLPSVASVLLGVFLVVVAGGFIATMNALNQTQTTTSQAEELFSSQRAYVAGELAEVLLTARTTMDATLTVHIPGFAAFEGTMESADLRTHTLVVKNIPPGTYEYFFTIATGGVSSDTKTFTFTMPR